MSRATDVLNDLFRLECGSLTHRLADAMPFVGSPADVESVERMIADEKDHERALAETIVALRGEPALPVYPTDTGGMHYLDLRYLMPQVLAAKRRLVTAYAQAGLTGVARADAVIARLLANHQRHLADLECLHGTVTLGVARAQPV